MTHGSQIRRPRAILFDNDGVLVRSEPLHWDAWSILLRELGIPYHEAELRARVGKTAPEILKELLDIHRPGWSPARYDLDALSLRKNDFYLQLTRHELRAYPGVVECLEWARQESIPAAVVSNAKRRELQAALDRLDLAKYFDLTLSRDDVPAFKPDPTPYLLAAAELGAEPGECVAVEDSPTGMEAALLAGTRAAGILTTFSREALEQPVPGRPDLRPGWIGASMVEFFEWIRSLPIS